MRFTLLALLLSGCASVSPVNIENRTVCTIDGKEAYVLSKWQTISIGAQVLEADAEIICKKGP